MKKKILCTMLAIALMVTMFSSCENNKNGTIDTNSTASDTTSISSEQGTTTSVPTEGKVEPIETDTTTSEQPDNTISEPAKENTISSMLDGVISKIVQDIVSSSEPTESRPEPTESTVEEPTNSQPAEPTTSIPEQTTSQPSEPVVINPEPPVVVSQPEKPVTIAVSSIILNKTASSLFVGESFTLTATISPANATNKSITWTSSNTSVAIVSNGKVTAKAKGTTTIIAKSSNGKTATCKVTVKEVDPYAKPFNAELIRQDMIRYIKSLGVNYVEMGLEDGTWTVPFSTYANYYDISEQEWNDYWSEYLKKQLYSIIDSDLKNLFLNYSDLGLTAEHINMCPYIYEDEENPGDLLITVIFN